MVTTSAEGASGLLHAHDNIFAQQIKIVSDDTDSHLGVKEFRFSLGVNEMIFVSAYWGNRNENKKARELTGEVRMYAS